MMEVRTRSWSLAESEEVVRPPAILVVGEAVAVRDRITKSIGEGRHKVIDLRQEGEIFRLYIQENWQESEV